MARLQAVSGLDMTDLNLNRIWQGATESEFINGTDGGEDVFLVTWSHEGTDFFTAIGGPSLTANDDTIFSGTATGYLDLFVTPKGIKPFWGIVNIAVSARAIYDAAKTRTTTDDYRIIKNALSGNDTMKFSKQADVGFGYTGNDKMFGYRGQDTLTGGAGRDTLFGGMGADKFVFNEGYRRDVVKDFTNNTDTLVLDKDLWGGGLTKRQVLKEYAEVKNGSVVLDFGDDELVLKGFDTIGALRGDIEFA